MIRRRVALSTAGAALLKPLYAASPAPAQFPAPDRIFRMRDGVVLPARLWPADPAVPAAGTILALHGFSDSRDAWEYPALCFTAAGYTLIAPDQRGFGATADRGIWAGAQVMIDDAAELAAQLRPHAPRLILMGESMGGAVAMGLAARDGRAADAFVLLAPAVWGRAQIPLVLRATLAAAGFVAPGWTLTGREIPLDIAASDNREALLRLAHDPLTLRGSTVAMLSGLVDLMSAAQDAASRLPSNTLILSGRRDQVIPPPATAAAWAKLPPGVRRGFYLGGYHLLLRDLGRALVEADILSWLSNPDRWLPSGADINAAAWQADHAWSAPIPAILPAAALDSPGRQVWPY